MSFPQLETRKRALCRMKEAMAQALSKVIRWTLSGVMREKVILLGLMIVATFLAFYNLEYSPRTWHWHDEGAAMSVSKTLVEDGVYAVKSSEGYQTFGPIQSVGPTVLLPVALSFKLFGVGLLQGRLVMAIYLLLTTLVFYGVGRVLFGRWVALLAVALLLGSPSAKFLCFGRQVSGELPALGFFLGGGLVWWYGGRQTQRFWSYFLAGLLVGAAMVTKTTYVPLGFATLALLIIFDRLFYRQGNIRALVIIGIVALLCVAAWMGWQVLYFGLDTFQENTAKLAQLANSTSGFDPVLVLRAIKMLHGSYIGYFHYFWGIPALIYVAGLSLKRSQDSFRLAWLVIFAGLWLGYYFWTMPFITYIFAPAAIAAFFVGKLWSDLISSFTTSTQELWAELRQGKPIKVLSIPLALIVLSLILFSLLNTIWDDVLAKDEAPQQVVAFLSENVDKNSLVETWERELNILTHHRYHFPDQSMLTQTHAARYRGGAYNYVLGADYFKKYQPAYLVVGWYAKWSNLYDNAFLAKHAELLTTIGSYDVYKLYLSSPSESDQ
jgi:4-amino-4-deoxy-L-arabinose transferase-like glycosyltransferase